MNKSVTTSISLSSMSTSSDVVDDDVLAIIVPPLSSSYFIHTIFPQIKIFV